MLCRIFVARLWTFSMAIDSFLCITDHTALPYSRCGRTKLSLSILVNVLRIRPSTRFAFLVDEAICVWNLSLLSTITPRSFSFYETSCVFYIPEPLARGYKTHYEFNKYRMKWKFISDSFYHMIILKNINMSWKKYVFWENFARKSPWSVVLDVTS